MAALLLNKENIASSQGVSEVPIKNTFIHFNLSEEKGVASKLTQPRVLRRWHTDEPPVRRSLHSDHVAAPAAISSESESATEVASDADPLETSFEGTAALEDSFDLNTPEQTPRHSKDPWTPVEDVSSPEHALLAFDEALVSDAVPAASQHNSPHQSATVEASPATSNLPEIPAMSFGSTQAPVPAPALSPLAAAAVLAATPGPTFLDGGYCFNFTLRLAEDIGLGIDLAPCWENYQALIIERILPNGAIAAWNAQCFDGSMKQLKAIWPGDAIVCVNGKTDRIGMTSECRDSMLLKITVFRLVAQDGIRQRSSARPYPLQCYEGDRLHSSKALIVI